MAGPGSNQQTLDSQSESLPTALGKPGSILLKIFSLCSKLFQCIFFSVLLFYVVSFEVLSYLCYVFSMFVLSFYVLS